MTTLDSKMKELEQNPWMLLEGRIAFRKRWALSGAFRAAPPSRRALQWEIDYDEGNNFAHMGLRFVDDDWGRPKPKKPRASAKADFLKRAFILATARAMQANVT